MNTEKKESPPNSASSSENKIAGQFLREDPLAVEVILASCPLVLEAGGSACRYQSIHCSNYHAATGDRILVLRTVS